MSEQKPKAIRRIVTGHASQASATVLWDGTAKNVRPSSSQGQFTTLMWCTDDMPANIGMGLGVEDMGNRKLGTYPPVNGSRFMIAEYPPGNKPVMHRTETLDYIIVLEGTVEMELDNGETVTMAAGDVTVQRGTNHAWKNVSDSVCRIAFVLLDAAPLGIGHAVPRNAIVGDHVK